MKKTSFWFLMVFLFLFSSCGINKKFIVTYESELGVAPFPIEVDENTILTKFQLPKLSQAGWIFLGWFDGEIEAKADEYTVTYDVTLTAKWEIEPPKQYIVTYSTEHGIEPSEISVEENTKLTSEQLPELSEAGWIFLGWFDGEIEAKADEYTVISDVTLTANWEIKIPKITYNHYIMTLDSTEDNVKYDLIETTENEIEETLNGYSIENTYTNSELNRDYVRPVSYIGDVFDDNFDGSNSTSVIDSETVINVYWKRAKCKNTALFIVYYDDKVIGYNYGEDYLNETILTGCGISFDRFDYSKVEDYGIPKATWKKLISNTNLKFKYNRRKESKVLNSKDVMNSIESTITLN